MFIFRFAIFNIAALITIFFGTIKIIEDYQPNPIYTILILIVATLLFIKTYNYCFHWGSEPKEKKKSKKKKNEGPVTNFIKGIYELFDFFLGWAVPFVVLYLFITLMAWVSS